MQSLGNFFIFQNRYLPIHKLRYMCHLILTSQNGFNAFWNQLYLFNLADGFYF